MTTVSQAMEAFVSSLELSESKREEAQRQWKVLDDNLKAELCIQKSFLSGSYGRNTAIAPLNDIDLFVVFEPKEYPDMADGKPEKALQLIQDAMDQCYPTAKPAIVQNRSVHIEFSTSGIAYDVVPAFPDADNADVYWIPDRETHQWVRTNPKKHMELSTKANKLAGTMAKPLVKAVKHWKNLPDSPDLRSFHLEWMVYDALGSKPDNYLDGLVTIFGSMADRVLTPFSDPAGLGSPIDNNLDSNRRQTLRQTFLIVAETLRKAQTASKEGRTEEAHYLLRQIFADKYPEKGSAPRSAGNAVAGLGAVDNPHNRFG